MGTPLPDNPFNFDPEPSRFVLDVDAFMAAIEPAPLFISDPSPEYMTAVELMPIVEAVTAHL